MLTTTVGLRLILFLFICISLTSVLLFYFYPQSRHVFLNGTETVGRRNWIEQFRNYDFKVYSQNGEDGILLWIFLNIVTSQNPGYFVEFGVEDGMQCNTRFLRENLRWKGLMMDGSHQNDGINLHREIITPQNINQLLEKYNTPNVFDLLSIDVDFDDYFVWKSILQKNQFRPRVVVIEYNYAIPANENRVVDPNQDSRRWTGTTHFGASILALTKLGQKYGYTLVYAEKNGVNLFFIETSILEKQGVRHQVPSMEELYSITKTLRWKHRPELDASRRWIWNDIA